MRTVGIAAEAELRKSRSSRVLLTTSVLVIAGAAGLAAALTGAARAGNQQILAQLGPLESETGWSLLTGVTAQITAVGTLLAFGVALSWMFGREFSEGTITGLFALPVSRPVIALAKVGIYLAWVTLMAAALSVMVLGAGLVLGLGPVTGEVVGQLARQFMLTLLSGMLALPAGWAATLGGGLLPGIATALGILIAAQISTIAVPDLAAWLPFSAPALWAMQPGMVGPAQLGVVVFIPMIFAGLIALSWHRLQLDR